MLRPVALLLVACVAGSTGCGRKDAEDLRITNDDRRPARPRDPKDEPAPAEPSIPPAAGPMIVLDDKRLTIDGVLIPLEPHVSDFVALFGKAERMDPSGNTIHIYESKGLLLYESPASGGRVIELTVIFGEQPGFPFTPKKFFAGSLLVQGLRVQSTTTLADVEKKLTMFTWDHGLGNDVDTYISKHQTFFIAPEKTNEVAEVAISFPQSTPPP